MRFTLLVPGWIGVPVTGWMLLGSIQHGSAWHSKKPNAKTVKSSHEFINALADQVR